MFGFFGKEFSEELFKERAIRTAMREAQLEANEAGFQLRQKAVMEISSELATGKTEVLNEKIEAAKEIAEFEHDFHKAREEKNTELAKLDVALEYKKKLLEETKDTNAEIFNAKLQALQDSANGIIETKNEMIALLTTQVEVLTAKLTEIKIDSVQLTANLKTDKD